MSVATKPISVIEDFAPRPDLESRREVKFVFQDRPYGSLRDVLLRSCHPIVYAGPVSTVRSVYFDDSQLSACRANLDGLGVRHKARIRWYDDEFPRDRMVFELKWRRHRTTGKNRVHLSCDGAAEMPSQTLQAHCRSVLPDDLAMHMGPDLRPVVLVEYEREHFALRTGEALDSQVRFTLDSNIRFLPQCAGTWCGRGFGHRLNGVTLIECKAPASEVARAVRTLAPLGVRAARFSKYVAACMALGHVSAA